MVGLSWDTPPTVQIPDPPRKNGSHERMHADLSREIQGKIAGGVAANQRAIDAWVEEYNFVRPHESIGMMTPSEVYTKVRHAI